LGNEFEAEADPIFKTSIVTMVETTLQLMQFAPNQEKKQVIGLAKRAIVGYFSVTKIRKRTDTIVAFTSEYSKGYQIHREHVCTHFYSNRSNDTPR